MNKNYTRFLTRILLKPGIYIIVFCLSIQKYWYFYSFIEKAHSRFLIFMQINYLIDFNVNFVLSKHK